jgi:NAD-dependent deacetylase
MSDTLERVGEGDEDPACLRCGGLLKAGTLSVGQPIPVGLLATAQTAVDEGDLLLLAGATPQTPPIAELVRRARRAGTRVVLLTPVPVKGSEVADAVLIAPVGETLASLVGRVVAGNGASSSPVA